MHTQIPPPIDLHFTGRINTKTGKPLSFCRLSLREFKEDQKNHYEICLVNLCRSDNSEKRFMRFGNYYFPQETLGRLYEESIEKGFYGGEYNRELTDKDYLPGKIIVSTEDQICLEEQNSVYGSTWRKTIFIEGPYIRTTVEKNVEDEWVEQKIPLCLPLEDFQILMNEAQGKGWF